MFPTSTKKNLCILLLLLAVYYHSQVYKFDDLERITKEYKNKGDAEGALKFNLTALDAFKKENNAEGAAASKINIGNLLSTLNRHKESIEYLNRAKARMKEIKNPLLNARLYNEYGRNYALLGLYEQSNMNLNKSLQFSKDIQKEQDRIDCQVYSYSWKSYNFDHLDEKDSLYHTQYKGLKRFPKESLVYEKIASRYVREKKHLDSAEYYLKKALPLSKLNPFYHTLVLTTYGDLYNARKEPQKALEYYFQGLDYYKKIKNKKQIGEIYIRISEMYKELNDTEKANEYLAEASKINRQVRESEKKIVTLVVKNLIEEKESEKRKEETRLYIVIGFIIIAALALIYFLRRRFIKKQAKQEELIEQKSQEAEKLEKQVNLSFDEVMQLAKSADPFFLTRFKEVYPDFYEKLMTHTSDLTENDVRFCAYMRLNLNTKEIAQYENVAIRTVESKKYRLKKKLDLPSEVDLTKWILEL